jgi:Ca-activated chloride channel homolog
MKLFLIIPIFSFSLYTAGQSAATNDLLLQGNNYYKAQEFAKANEAFQQALKTAPENTTAKFNLAASLYRLDKKDEAAQLYTELADKETDKALLAKAWYNKGVILSGQKKLEESIEAYKNALRNNPADKETRENLQKALLERNKKNQSKKQDNNQQKKQEQPKPNQSKMKPKEADQRLKLLQQKEKEVQERVQKEKTKGSSSQSKDW